MVADIGDYNKEKLQEEAEKLLTEKISFKAVTCVPKNLIAEESFSEDEFVLPTVSDIGKANREKLYEEADRLLKTSVIP